MDTTFHPPDEMTAYLGLLMHRRRVESSAALLRHFGFREDPFRVSPDPGYMYPSQTHLQALASLEDGFYNDRGFIAMIAPPGMGKTTLLYRFLEDTQAVARSVFLFDIDSECEPRDFVGYILRDFGITPASASSEMHKQLGEVLVKETQAGRKCVVVIDEAQNLSDAVLERVRLLTNFETSQGKLLQIILSGQPQLTEKLMQASLVQLLQRVSTVCHLERLSAEEVAAYIDFRLNQAGYDGDPLFTEGALKLIAETSNGTPRTINNLCFNALSLASSIKSKQVDETMVAKVASSLRLVPQSSQSIAASGNVPSQQPDPNDSLKQVQQRLTLWRRAVASHVLLWAPATVGVLVLCALGVIRLSGVGASQPRTTADERPLIPQVAPAPVSIPAAPQARRVVAAKPTPKTNPMDAGRATASRISAALSQPATAEQSRSALAAANLASPQQTPARVSQSSSSVPAPAPAPASLTIDSIPQGADIEIDGEFVGSTPSMVMIGPGPHRVTVNRKGYSSWTKTLTVSGGAIHLNAELEQQPPKP